MRVYLTRIAAGLTQPGLARRTGLTQSYLSRLERGLVANPRDSDVHRVACALGRTVEELITAETSPTDELLVALTTLSGEPALSRSLLDLARNWSRLSLADRNRTLDAIEKTLAGLPGRGADPS